MYDEFGIYTPYIDPYDPNYNELTGQIDGAPGWYEINNVPNPKYKTPQTKEEPLKDKKPAALPDKNLTANANAPKTNWLMIGGFTAGGLLLLALIVSYLKRRNNSTPQ